MKSVLSLAIFAGVALAQSAQIGYPVAGQMLTKGTDVTVQIQRPVCLERRLTGLSGDTESNQWLELFDWIRGNGRCHWHCILRFPGLQPRRRGHGRHSLQWPIQTGLSRVESASLPELYGRTSIHFRQG